MCHKLTHNNIIPRIHNTHIHIPSHSLSLLLSFFVKSDTISSLSSSLFFHHFHGSQSPIGEEASPACAVPVPRPPDLLAAGPPLRLRRSGAGHQRRDHAAPPPEAPPGLRHQLQQGSRAAPRRHFQGRLRRRREVAERHQVQRRRFVNRPLFLLRFWEFWFWLPCGSDSVSEFNFGTVRILGTGKFKASTCLGDWWWNWELIDESWARLDYVVDNRLGWEFAVTSFDFYGFNFVKKKKKKKKKWTPKEYNSLPDFFFVILDITHQL